MDERVLHHVLYKLVNAKVQAYPYPHFYVEDVFPKDFYQKLVAQIPDLGEFKSLAKSGRVDPRTYKERYVLPLTEEKLGGLGFSHLVFWSQMQAAFECEWWKNALLKRFDAEIQARFGTHYPTLSFFSEIELIKDQTNYSIRPHTDHPIKVLTLLFYLPQDDALSHLGTSVYAPVDPAFECDGLKHHPYENFVKLETASYKPNSVFGFIRTDQSFHGVEPIKDEGITRCLLNYSLQWEQAR